jgi:amino acid adenylation domain-containing protein
MNERHLETIHELFERQVSRTPHTVALFDFGSDGKRQLTFSELNVASNQFANNLLARGCRSEDVIAVGMVHSVDLIVALLGIVKMGGSFLAIDTNWPESRINHVISDSKSRLIVTSIGLVGKFLKSGVEVCAFDSENAILKLHDKNNLNVSVTSQSPAYVIFTSGSTGAPKGVIGSHGGLVNRVQWMHKAYPFQAHERSCAKTTLGFVDSITEIFTPLCAGVPLYLFGDQAAKQPSQLVAMLSEHRITRLVLVPSLLHTMLMLHPTDLPKLCPDLKLWEVSGEALSVPLARAFKAAVPSAMLINMYGSSEVGPDATCHEITDHDIRAEATSVPIGTSISNMKCYVLDDDMRPVREGEKGHIYVGGRGVSVRGYINKPDLTAKAFIPNPILKGRELFPVLYKMGDVGSQSVNGVLSFHGRSDHQIKINGNRVELGETKSQPLL